MKQSPGQIGASTLEIYLAYRDVGMVLHVNRRPRTPLQTSSK